jgi:hypothetical protein
MEALSSSETSVITRATWRNIPEDAILQDQNRCLIDSLISEDTRERKKREFLESLIMAFV